MHKIIPTLFIAAATLTACSDYNDNFEGLKEGPQPTDVKKFDYTLTPEDYQYFAKPNAKVKAALKAVEGDSLKVVNAAKKGHFPLSVDPDRYIPLFLYDRWLTADDGSTLRVKFRQEVETIQKAEGKMVLNETFEAMEDKTLSPAKIEGWQVITTQGAANWEGRFRNDNNYLQASAFNQPGAVRTYLISPLVTPEKGMHLTFDALTGHYKEQGGRLSLFLAPATADLTAPDATKWLADLTAKLTIESTPGGYGTFKPCDIDLSAYAGQSLRIVFRYDGDGSAQATTTYQLDNVAIGSGSSEKKVVSIDNITRQYSRADSQWKFNPSVDLILPVSGSDPVSKPFYQALVDWVTQNVDQPAGIEKGKGYVSAYGNNDYYTGASAYRGNFDHRAEKARTQFPDGYKDMSDEDIVRKLQARMQEVIAAVLPQFYPDLEPIDGMEVFATLRFGVYDGTETATYEMKFKVVAKGKFEFVKGSYKKV